MQHNRTPSSILKRKAAAQEAAARRARQKGRRVSFAPDEDLVTTQLYALEHSPSMGQPIGGAQPLGDVQNMQPDPAIHAMWQLAKPAHEMQLPPALLVENSPGFSPTSMELTNDTLQPGGPVVFDLGGQDTDSLSLPKLQPLAKDAAHNITDNVPGLSTLVEEDEEAAMDAAHSNSDAGLPAAGACSAPADTGEDDDDGTNMELTGATACTPAERVPSQALTPPSAMQLQLQSPSRYTTRSAGKHPPAAQPLLSPLSPLSPGSARRRRRARRSSVASPAAAMGAPSPGLSPLRRVTRSISVDVPLIALSPLGQPLPVARAGSAAAAAGASTRCAGARLPLDAPSPLDRDSSAAAEATHRADRLDAPAAPTACLTEDYRAAAAAQQSKWGFVPGDDDTLLLELDRKGAGLGEATLHHVYAESAVTGELTMAARRGSLPLPLHPTDSGALQPAQDEGAGGCASHAQLQPAALAGSPDGDTPAAPAGQGADALEGMTTRLLLDEQPDEGVRGWLALAPPHEANAAHTTMGLTGRGSVGSNMPTANLAGRRGETTQLMGGTTQLLDENNPHHAARGDMLHPGGAAGAAPALDRAGRRLAAGEDAGPGTFPAASREDTMKLLADATAASSCMPRFTARALQPAGGAGDPAAAHAPSPPRPPAVGTTARPQRALVDGSAPPRLMAGTSAPGDATRGRGEAGHGLLLEDATLDDFAPPPELGGGHGSSNAPATLPFSGTLAVHARTPGSASRPRVVPRISFGDFLQIVDLQFLDHIRRGTSINQVDLAPGPEPQDVPAALRVTCVTGSEAAVLEGTIGHLQQLMREKRNRVRQLEEALEDDNPPVFQLVQAGRRSELEGMKHALALHKKGCRAETGAAWKELRCSMERQLAGNLAEQQQELNQHLQFVQAKLLRAGQQATFVAEFGADVRRSMAAEAAAAGEAAAARAALRNMRQRLEQLRALNDERAARAKEVSAQQEALQARRAHADGEVHALRARLAALREVVAVPTPKRGAAAAERLVDASQQLDILTGLQAWQLRGGADGAACVLDFQGRVQARLEVGQLSAGPAVAMSVSVVPPAAGTAPGMAHAMLVKLIAAQPSSFSVAAVQLQSQLVCVGGRIAHSLEAADALAAAALQWPLLAGGDVDAAAGQLVLTFLEAERGIKAQVHVRLADVLEPRLRGAGMEWSVRLMAAGGELQRGALEQRLSAALAPEATSGLAGGTVAALLHTVCTAMTSVLREAPARPPETPAPSQRTLRAQ